MPEIVNDGETGFLVDNLDAAEAALGHVRNLDRRTCRAHVEARFSAQRMVDDYVRLYRRLLNQE